ncbi:MAG: helix-turn-helix transcriptional regulator [Clostridia bacterium]|nr:helix-turn-helix transcriptional regulator [Clostridia bacterium]
MAINFYLVKIRSVPRILFAHGFHTENYYYERLAQYHHIEISSMEHGVVHRSYNSGLRIDIPENAISVQFPLGDRSFSQSCDGYHSHNTIGFICDYTVSKIDKEKITELTGSVNNLPSWNTPDDPDICFIFPDILMPSANAIKVRNLCRRVIQEFNTANPAFQQLSGVSYLFLLFKLLTEISCELITEQEVPDRFARAYSLYTKQAVLYISDHIDEKINVGEIADHLGISVGYLSNIFKHEMGQTLVKYINGAKMKKVIDLVQHNNVIFSQAGRIVGIEDAHYLSRLFRKLYGVSFREYIDHSN